MKEPEFKVLQAFASPIISVLHPQPQPLNTALASLFLAREGAGEQFRKAIPTPTTQVNIFESEFDLFAWPDAPVAQLRDFCVGALRETVVRLNDFSPRQLALVPKLRMHLDSWFHVTRHGGFIGAHSHPMASWSGVYCVQPGEQPADKPASGLLRFLDTRPHASMYLDPGNVRLRAPFSTSSLDIRLVPGLLLLFPSYLMHEVLPFYGRDERITVAFNASFTRPEGAAFGF